MQSAHTNMQAAPAMRHFVHISLYLVGSTLASATLAAPFANAEEMGRSAVFFHTPPQPDNAGWALRSAAAHDEAATRLTRAAVWESGLARSAVGDASDDTPVKATQVTLDEGLPVADVSKRGGIAPIGVPSQQGVVSVTLWDEVVSPSHVPRPSDTTQEKDMPYSNK